MVTHSMHHINVLIFINILMRFKQFINEMAYPSSFNMEEFKTIKQYSKKVKYAAERLRKIGSGQHELFFRLMMRRC